MNSCYAFLSNKDGFTVFQYGNYVIRFKAPYSLEKFSKNVKQKCLTSFCVSCILFKVSAMERIAKQAMLYDFYGELLTEHQKKIYEDVVYNDFSLSEIAEENGISRQGVHDLIRRCNRILQEYENKLHLIERFVKIREEVGSIQKLTENPQLSREELICKMNEISNRIMNEL